MDRDELSWIFNRRRPQRNDDRGAERNFTNDIESLVRESIQNSTDARERALELKIIDEEDPTTIHFQLLKLGKVARKKFLKGIKGNILTKHIKRSDVIRTEKNAKTYFDPYSSDNFTIMAIHDYNTIGLMGKEIPKGREDSPFSALCRDSGISNKGQISSRGGSYGMGKSVFWKFSEFNTVLFLSYTEHPDSKKMQYRLYGLADIGSHIMKNAEYDGIGELGFSVADDSNVTGAYAKSAWADNIDYFDFLPKQILDMRKGKRGTTIMILSFTEFDVYNEHLEGMSTEIYKWFWPLIQLNKLKVYISNNKRSEELDLNHLPLEFVPFSEIFTHAIYNTVDSIPPMIKVQPIDVTFPPKLSDSTKSKIKSNAQLLLMERDEFEESPDMTYSNRIVWLRGAFSVVKYEKVQNPGGVAPYFGLLLAGNAVKMIDSEAPNLTLFDDFLRYAETPSHDDWNYSKSKLKEEYGAVSGARTNLTSMKHDFKNVNILLNTETNENSYMPSIIMNDLPTSESNTGVGSKGIGRTKRTSRGTTSGKKSEFSVELLSSRKKNTEMQVEFKVATLSEQMPWKLQFVPYILDENSKSIGQLNTKISLSYAGVSVDSAITNELSKNEYEITVTIENIPEEYENSEIAIDVKAV